MYENFGKFIFLQENLERLVLDDCDFSDENNTSLFFYIEKSFYKLKYISVQLSKFFETQFLYFLTFVNSGTFSAMKFLDESQKARFKSSSVNKGYIDIIISPSILLLNNVLTHLMFTTV